MKKKIISVYAYEVQAGDTIVVKQGNVRKFFHVCEFALINEERCMIVYNGSRGEFVRIDKGVNDTVRIRIEE